MSTQDALFKKRKYLSKKDFKRRMRSAFMGKKVPVYKSLRSTGTHTLTKAVELRMQFNTTGYSWNTGTTPLQLFSIWFTQQDVWIYFNSSNFSTASIPGYSDLAALFDEVMLFKVEMTVFSCNEPTTTGLGTAQIGYCRDYNNKVAPASTGDVLQYADCKPMNMSNNFINKFTVYPKFLTYSSDAAGTSTASIAQRGYFRSNLQTEHYGIKGCFINPPPNSMYHTYYFKYTYKCKIAK